MVVDFSAKLKKANSLWNNAREQRNTSTFNDVDDGFYTSRLNASAITESTNGALQVHLGYTVLDGEFQGSSLHKYYNIEDENGLKFLSQDLDRFGYPVDEFDLSQLPAVLEDLATWKPVVRLKVTTTTNDKGSFKNVYLNQVYEDNQARDIIARTTPATASRAAAPAEEVPDAPPPTRNRQGRTRNAVPEPEPEPATQPAPAKRGRPARSAATTAPPVEETPAPAKRGRPAGRTATTTTETTTAARPSRRTAPAPEPVAAAPAAAPARRGRPAAAPAPEPEPEQTAPAATSTEDEEDVELQVGDWVEFESDGGEVLEGEITRLHEEEGEVTVKTESGKKYIVNAEDVTLLEDE